MTGGPKGTGRRTRPVPFYIDRGYHPGMDLLLDNPLALAAYILACVALFVAWRFACLVAVAAYALHRARQIDADTWDQIDAVNRRLGWRVRRWAARISPRPV